MRVYLLVMFRILVVVAVATVLLRTAPVSRDPVSRHPAQPSSKPILAGWTTRGVDIHSPTGTPFVIAGVSWYGAETPQAVVFGLDRRDYTDILRETKAYHFNAVRIPFSNEMWETNSTVDL